MANDKALGGEFIDPRQKEKVKYLISRDQKSKGRYAISDSFGTIPTDQQFEEAELMGSLTAPLPSSVDIAMPTIRNQGSEGSCGSWAVGYYMRSALEKKKTGASSYSDATNTFSPEYLFSFVKSQSTCSSSSIITNANFLKSNGVCLWNTAPYSWLDGCDSARYSSAVNDEAANYKISSYYFVVITDIVGIKQLLNEGYPVCVQVGADDYFVNATTGFIWDTAHPTIYGPHIITICGYDDSVGGGSWKLANSWGTSWGTNGYGWLTYALSPHVSSSAMVMKLAEPPAPTVVPVASAGYDTTVTGSTVKLDGSASYDPDGYIATYAWSRVSGPNVPTFSAAASPVTEVSNLVPGTYVFRLSVTDNDVSPNSATDDVTVTVIASQSATLSVTKFKKAHNLSWGVTSSYTPLSIVLEFNIVGPTAPYSALYMVPISQYNNGSYSNTPNRTRVYYYYRLKITDYNGTVRYSNVVSVR